MGDRPDYVEEQDVHAPVDSGNLLPVVKLMQALSPELDKADERYVEGAEVGDIVVVDGADKYVFGGEAGIRIIPIIVRKQWVEWVPRKMGGGFVAAYNTKEEMEAGVTKGNEVQVSIDYLCVTPELVEGELKPVVLQFNSATKLGVARSFAEMIKKFRTMIGVSYIVHSVRKTNRQRQVYYNFGIRHEGWVQKELYTTVQAIQAENQGFFLSLNTTQDAASEL
jgi:hypothetical protein